MKVVYDPFKQSGSILHATFTKPPTTVKLVLDVIISGRTLLI